MEIFGHEIPRNDADLIIIPVCWEPTASYGKGCAQAPSAICEASSQMDYFLPWLPGGVAERVHMRSPLGIPMNEKACQLAKKVFAATHNKGQYLADTKELNELNALCETLNELVRVETCSTMAQGKCPVILGGDHSTPLGAYLAANELGQDFGILHIDAHCDLREGYMGMIYSHASIMYNALEQCDHLKKIVQVGIRDFCEEEYTRTQSDRVTTFFDRDNFRRMDGGASWSEICEQVIGALPDRVWFSVDIDGLDPSLCPGTGTPVPGGLSYQQAMALMDTLRTSGKQIIGADLVEVAPSSGTTINQDVGARVLYQLISVCLGSRD